MCVYFLLEGIGAVVLVRALSPTEGATDMRTLRGRRRSDEGRGLKDHQLCNGPSKLCMALDIDKAFFNEKDVTVSESLWLEKGQDVEDSWVVVSKRVGLNSAAEEWKDKPWRFYLKGNSSVSVRDQEAENISDVVL